MSRLKNLYTQLVTLHRAKLEGWLQDYRAFTHQVGLVRAALVSGKALTDLSTYAGTVWESAADPWDAFSNDLLRSNNGVTTTGQSIITTDNLRRLLNDTTYLAALQALIAAPSPASFRAFESAWEALCVRLQIRRNPLLINRTAAACTLQVSSTVNNADFESVYGWLIQQKLLPAEADQAEGWYERNAFLMGWLQEREFADMLASGETDLHALSSFVWELRANLASPFELKKQLIRYGAPGTGKTFSAMRDTRLQFDIWKTEFGANSALSHEQCCQTVQFHPSFGYEDFLEGLRPVLHEGRSQLVLQNGIFKRLCIAAGKWERDVFLIPDAGQQLCGRWKELRVVDLAPYREHLSGSHWEPVFAYPDPECRLADAVPPFFLIIDEINRAELARVLGELMVCLEYRGPVNAILTQYARMNDAATGMLRTDADSYKFFVPHNVFIIGTMNTIDRSVESFDLALRRRFAWERIEPDLELLRYHLRSVAPRWVGMADSLERLNAAICANELLGQDYQIGQAYLMNLPYSRHLTQTEAKQRVWNDSIAPLLHEYVRGSGPVDEQMGRFAAAFGVE